MGNNSLLKTLRNWQRAPRCRVGMGRREPENEGKILPIFQCLFNTIRELLSARVLW